MKSGFNQQYRDYCESANERNERRLFGSWYMQQTEDYFFGGKGTKNKD